MKTSHLSHALNALVSRRGTTLTELADQAGLSQGTLSRLASRDQRPDMPSLRAICTQIPELSDGLDLLLAHLRDEVERAGRLQTEVTIMADGQDTPDDIRLLVEQCQSDDEMRAILHDLAQLVRAIRRKNSSILYPEHSSSALKVAETIANSIVSESVAELASRDAAEVPAKNSPGKPAPIPPKRRPAGQK